MIGNFDLAYMAGKEHGFAYIDQARPEAVTVSVSDLTEDIYQNLMAGPAFKNGPGMCERAAIAAGKRVFEVMEFSCPPACFSPIAEPSSDTF